MAVPRRNQRTLQYAIHTIVNHREVGTKGSNRIDNGGYNIRLRIAEFDVEV
jgi:hypothetical protein